MAVIWGSKHSDSADRCSPSSVPLCTAALRAPERRDPPSKLRGPPLNHPILALVRPATLPRAYSHQATSRPFFGSSLLSSSTTRGSRYRRLRFHCVIQHFDRSHERKRVWNDPVRRVRRNRWLLRFGIENRNAVSYAVTKQ